jgi:ABC-2 type transport system ATP-binding protein
VCALDVGHLEIERAKVTGIIGPNGAGKTTLIDVITGLVHATTGKVTVLGADVTRESEALAIRARIGVVPQETALYDELTPVQNLEFSAALYSVEDAKKRIREVLELVGLSARQRDRVGTLSGGMQRRLAIARALLHEPELLLLDEPTLGVDVEARHQIWNHIRHLRDEGRTTIVLATNYLDEAEALCDSVAVLREGRIAVRDSPAAIIGRAGRCLELECASGGGDVERVRGAVAVHPRAIKTEVSAPDRVTVWFDDGADPEELVRAAMEQTRLRGFRVRSPDLMEVLRTITGDAA